MAKLDQQYTWENKNFFDDIEYRETDAEAFRRLLHGGKKEEKRLEVAPGAILRGTIVEITKDYAVVDVGLKSEGLVPLGEFRENSELELGHQIDVFLDQPEDEHGQIVLSKEKADRQRQWEYIVQHCSEGSDVKGKVVRKVKGGLIVDIGIEAFLPGSQIDNKRIKNLDEYIGVECEFKIIKLNKERENVVVSRRVLLEAERISKKAEILDTIKVSDVRRGVVKNITDFGVFLDLDGIDGLLHITDMTWKRIKHPSEMVQIGQELEVMILSIDKEKGRVALGLKQKEHNPWEEIESRYPTGTRVKGKITKLLPYGAFLELEPGIEGLIHISEMSWTKNISDPSEIVSKGQDLEAIVLGVQPDEGKISLGLKQVESNPWDDIELRHPIESSVKVEIKSLTNYGAFVEIEPGIEGLIHISDISWIKKVSHPSEIFKKGDLVDAVILSIDKASKKIALGVKQLSTNPWENLVETMPVGSLVRGKVAKTTAFGAFVILDNGIEALIHVTELSDRTIGKVEDVISVGDTVTAKVMRIDPDHKKVALSIKEFLVERDEINRDDIVVGANVVEDEKEAPKGRRVKKG